MTDFLLELRSEEIPARMQDKARDDLARLFAAELDKAGLKATALETYATPRRLTLIARDLPAETAAVSEETKGPRANAPEQALEGFLRKTGLTRDALVERDGVLYAVIDKPGRATAGVLAEAIPAIIRAFPWPKAMRWGEASQSTESLRWVRPLHGIVALFGDAVVPCEIAGVTSGSATLGHRFHHPGVITIGSASDYVEKLRACHVIVDQDERRATIRDRAAALAAEAGLELIEDEGLVAENAGLTEWPVPLLGRFDEAFLDVPPEVIQLTARVNQKYFVCRGKDGNLANAFICTANIVAADGGAKIVEGNRKVLAARLSDARFFYETDLKVPLADQATKLEKIVFHEKLGTLAEKVDRVAKLARWLAETGMVRGADPMMAERAARLAKADLVTGMVGEFPELQGLIGGYYARAQGEPIEVAAAIRDHYKPVGQGDVVPTAAVTVAVALADKLDTLSLFFLVGLPPSGSKDPFALRRAALGVLELITVNGIRGSLADPAVIGPALFVGRKMGGGAQQSFSRMIDVRRELGLDVSEEWQQREGAQVEQKLLSGDFQGAVYDTYIGPAWDKLLAFFADRLKVQQREAGVRHDLIDAVFALGGEDDLVRLLARVQALQAFVTTEDGANLLAGYKRAANILKKEGFSGGENKALSYVPEPAESALVGALDQAEPQARGAIQAEDFEGAMAALASLRGPIDRFFEEVTVNEADADKRIARLGLLSRVRTAVHAVADFSKIEG
ncbi:MAG: glycyl-tRNA synthetase subunit beta [Sphingomonas bacterium]|uniref:glycine--tRNA ligase subunit beta n=1 Tax=Sphingomonas bacterium TaxID=1895847 RepID=UPI002611FC34|nr:glycine--tRNA ligase subunit beta [Sphingomonas bacterium]MDB5707942.1 glycyl-tRNA synthetase subunit beta [Sphingomonas bacterium]